MPRRKKSVDETPSLLDITAKLRSGPCVPALREAVKSWQANGRNGITDTTRTLLEANKSVFNMTPCDNDFERDFARFLENADDVSAFAKLPQPFAFSIDYVDAGMNLRSYYPDFVALDSAGQHWLIETKGMESAEVSQKDAAAENWCENASALTGTPWQYRKIPQKAFEVLQPSRLADLAALHFPQQINPIR